MAEESKLAEKLEEKTTDTKFTQEEMDKLKSFQDRYLGAQASFGNIEVAKIRVNQELETIEESKKNLEKEFKELQKEELQFMDDMTKKYGDGQLNPSTGVFTANNS